jgi:hypothetical protein
MNNRIWLSILLGIVGVFLLSACQMVRGSGDVVTETRDVSNFDSVALKGSGDVVIDQSGGESLTIETDDNVLQYVTSEVSGGTLILGFEPGTTNISPTKLIFAVGVDDLVGARVDGSGDITAGSLETDSLDVDISGSGNVTIDDLTAEELAIVIDGSGDVQMAGEVEQQSIDIGGSGKYSAGDLRSDSATVSIDGSADAIVWAMKTLDVDISGSGSVDYYGSPRISSSQSGSGSLNSMGEKEG